MSRKKNDRVVNQLRSEVARHPELSLREPESGRFVITGGVSTIDYYPLTANRSAYIAGVTTGAEWVDPQQAVEMALNVPPVVEEEKRITRKNLRRHKLRLLRDDPFCFWCREKINDRTATVDHKIPLARGGMTVAENLVLACASCNLERGHDMPEIQEMV